MVGTPEINFQPLSRCYFVILDSLAQLKKLYSIDRRCTSSRAYLALDEERTLLELKGNIYLHQCRVEVLQQTLSVRIFPLLHRDQNAVNCSMMILGMEQFDLK